MTDATHGLDRFVDLLVAALRACAQQRVNDALASTTDSAPDAIVKTYGYPASLSLLSQLELPALCVFRLREVVSKHSAGHQHDRKTTVRFDYFAPKTPLAKLDVRWPALVAVFDEVVAALCDGTWRDSSDVPRTLLEDAGVTSINDATWQVTYDFAEDGGQAYPAFVATVEIMHRAIDATEYADLIDMLADYIDERGQVVVSDLLDANELTDDEDDAP